MHPVITWRFAVTRFASCSALLIAVTTAAAATLAGCAADDRSVVPVQSSLRIGVDGRPTLQHLVLDTPSAGQRGCDEGTVTLYADAHASSARGRLCIDRALLDAVYQARIDLASVPRIECQRRPEAELGSYRCYQIGTWVEDAHSASAASQALADHLARVLGLAAVTGVQELGPGSLRPTVDPRAPRPLDKLKQGRRHLAPPAEVHVSCPNPTLGANLPSPSDDGAAACNLVFPLPEEELQPPRPRF